MLRGNQESRQPGTQVPVGWHRLRLESCGADKVVIAVEGDQTDREAVLGLGDPEVGFGVPRPLGALVRLPRLDEPPSQGRQARSYPGRVVSLLVPIGAAARAAAAC